MTRIVPDFIIAGTQKGGTTWLEQNLRKHPQIYTPGQQIHYFDREYKRGDEWYRSKFEAARSDQIIGEKTTEYLDTHNTERTAARIAEYSQQIKLIFMLRNPIDRALSAAKHMVNSGLEPFDDQIELLIFKDRERPAEVSFRYIDRGFYAQQLKIFQKHFPPAQILCILLEEDVAAQPEQTWHRVCDFLEVPRIEMTGLNQPVNRLRLSRYAAIMSKAFYNIPFARSVIRRIDSLLPSKDWQPVIETDTRRRLREIYAEDVGELSQLLGRQIPSWGFNTSGGKL